jgi:hypothetical protein
MLAEQPVLAARRLSAPKTKEDFIVEDVWKRSSRSAGCDLRERFGEDFLGYSRSLILPQTSVLFDL